MIVLEELSRSSSDDANRSSRAHRFEPLLPVALHTLPFRLNGLPPHVKNEHQNKQTINRRLSISFVGCFPQLSEIAESGHLQSTSSGPRP